MLHSSNPHITVTDYGTSMPYITTNMPNNASPGEVWYSGASNSLEVYDGCNWNPIVTDNSIVLNIEADEALAWAIEKMKEEQELEALAETNHAVRIALNNVIEAKKQLTVTAILAREHEQTTS